VVFVYANGTKKRLKTAIFSGHLPRGFRYGAVMPLLPNGRQNGKHPAWAADE
jgi:hypothetical protein